MGLRPDTVMGLENKYMYSILLLESKKAIRRKWLTDTPTLEDWVSVVQDIFKMESLTFILRLELPSVKDTGNLG